MEKAENYRQIDYYSAVLAEMVRAGAPQRAGAGLNEYIAKIWAYLFRLIKLRLKVYFTWTLIFSHYILSVLAIYAWIFMMVIP